MGLNQYTGEPIDPQMEGIFDNYSVKRQIINSGRVNLLQVPFGFFHCSLFAVLLNLGFAGLLLLLNCC